jgi:hypothetical protein
MAFLRGLGDEKKIVGCDTSHHFHILSNGASSRQRPSGLGRQPDHQDREYSLATKTEGDNEVSDGAKPRSSNPKCRLYL